MSTKLWALVTGASSGIGRALVTEFVRDRIPVILVARDEKRLNDFKDEIQALYGCEARVMVCDLRNPKSISDLVGRLAADGTEIGYLVNNAGFGLHGSFATTPVDSQIDLVQVQINAMLSLTKAFVPQMIARKKGHILNVSSVYSFSAVPFQSVYAACKSFMQSFSQALMSELAGTGVTVTVTYPGVTRTEFRSRAGMKDKSDSILAMDATKVALMSYRGMMTGKASVIPGIWNQFFALASTLIPAGLRVRCVRLINRLRGVNAH